MGTLPETAAGLDLFAAAWLERWRALHGSVMVDLETGTVQLCMPMPGHGGRPRIEGEGRQREGTEGCETGRRRELSDLLDLVPGGHDALAAHVLAFPEYTTARSVGA